MSLSKQKLNEVKAQNAHFNTTVRNAGLYDSIGRETYSGNKYGIEVELEGILRFSHDSLSASGWDAKGDGSLRDGLEFVLRYPMNYGDSVEALYTLRDNLEENDSAIANSVRTSTHVHVNVQDKKILDVLKIITAYGCVENLLMQWCGEDRAGNLFCLRQSDARYLPMLLREKVKLCDLFFNDRVRYASLNLTSLNRFGTLEFRGMRGADPDFENVVTWLAIINSLVTNAIDKFETPADIIRAISGEGVDILLQKLFPSDEIYRQLVSVPNYRRLVIESVRATQIWVMPVKWEYIIGKEEIPKTPTTLEHEEPLLKYIDQKYYSNQWQQQQAINLLNELDVPEPVFVGDEELDDEEEEEDTDDDF